MTLIVGTICQNGMVFCSDTQESTPQGGKRAVHKLSSCGGAEWSMFIGAAGHAALCDVGVKRMEALARSKPNFVANHEEHLEKELRAMYDRYVFPFPDEKQRERAVSFIIGIQNRQSKTTNLYKTCDEILQPYDFCACAGTGEDVAYYFLERLFNPGLNIFESEKLLTFIMKEAKASVGHVGRETEILTVNSKGVGGTAFYGSGEEAKLPQLVDCIQEFWKK